VSLVAVDATSLELSWDPPVPDTDDGAITNYHVNCISQQDTAGFLYADSLPPDSNRRLDIENLSPFTDYMCCVSVQTTGGTSPMLCLHQTTMEASMQIIRYFNTHQAQEIVVFVVVHCHYYKLWLPFIPPGQE